MFLTPQDTYYYGTNADFIGSILENGLGGPRSQTLLFGDRDKAMEWAEAVHGDQRRVIAVTGRYGISRADRPERDAPPGGFYAYGTLSPELLRIVPKIVTRAAPVAGSPGGPSAEERLLQAGFARGPFSPGNGPASYSREFEGGTFEIKVLEEGRTDINLYLHSEGRTALLRTWKVGRDLSSAQAVDEIIPFVEGAERFSTAVSEFETGARMKP